MALAYSAPPAPRVTAVRPSAGSVSAGQLGAATRPTAPAALPQYPHVSTLLTLLFCGYVFQWYLQLSIRMPALGAIRFEFMYAALLGVLALAKGVPLKSPVTGALLAFFAVTYIQVVFSRTYDFSHDVFVDRVLKFFCMTIFIVAFVKGPKQLKWFIIAFLLACMKMGQEGLHGRLTGGLVWQNQGVMRLHGPTPNYLHPNSFAGMALGTLPFVFYLYPLASKWQRAALGLQALFAGNIVLFSASRTAYVAFLGMSGTILLKAKRKSRAIVVTAMLLLALTPFIPQDYIDRFVSIGTRVEKEGKSAETREEILRDAWQIFLTYPFGVGVGAFPWVRYETFGRHQDTHNLYLEVATNLGIQGFIVFVLFVGGQLRLLGKLARGFADQDRTLSAIGAPGEEDVGRRAHLADLKLMAAVANATQVFIITRLLLGLFGMDLYEIYWWFAMGIVIALYRMNLVAEARTAALVGVTGKRALAPARGARLLPHA